MQSLCHRLEKAHQTSAYRSINLRHKQDDPTTCTTAGIIVPPTCRWQFVQRLQNRHMPLLSTITNCTAVVIFARSLPPEKTPRSYSLRFGATDCDQGLSDAILPNCADLRLKSPCLGLTHAHVNLFPRQHTPTLMPSNVILKGKSGYLHPPSPSKEKYFSSKYYINNQGSKVPGPRPCRCHLGPAGMAQGVPQGPPRKFTGGPE